MLGALLKIDFSYKAFMSNPYRKSEKVNSLTVPYPKVKLPSKYGIAIAALLPIQIALITLLAVTERSWSCWAWTFESSIFYGFLLWALWKEWQENKRRADYLYNVSCSLSGKLGEL